MNPFLKGTTGGMSRFVLSVAERADGPSLSIDMVTFTYIYVHNWVQKVPRFSVTCTLDRTLKY
jgi:hypothetical protein